MTLLLSSRCWNQVVHFSRSSCVVVDRSNYRFYNHHQNLVFYPYSPRKNLKIILTNHHLTRVPFLIRWSFRVCLNFSVPGKSSRCCCRVLVCTLRLKFVTSPTKNPQPWSRRVPDSILKFLELVTPSVVSVVPVYSLITACRLTRSQVL